VDEQPDEGMSTTTTGKAGMGQKDEAIPPLRGSGLT
jgi:hypothetical protein